MSHHLCEGIFKIEENRAVSGRVRERVLEIEKSHPENPAGVKWRFNQ